MLFSRHKLESLEDQSLAPYGIHSKDSKGRLYPEDEHEYRTCFQKDRDRVLHTTAFRRLEYKTQVFINYEGDYYRTRLTHTLEVAQIGRTIALALGANETLVEAICLAHDMGHPPFGHSGEHILNKLMKDHNGFEHNKQSFRIVTKLENRYPDFPGLNLTWETLEGIVKHETEYDKTDASEFNPELRGHLEAQITNIADELAYTAHDLDDGLRSGIITVPMLKDIELWKLVTDSIGWKGNGLDDLTRHRIIRRLIGIEMKAFLEATTEKINNSGASSVDEIQRLAYNVISFGDEIQKLNRQLKDFLFQEMYQHYRVVRMAVKAERIVEDLFNAYRSDPAILPKHVQLGIDQDGLEQTICDYIAGMTDRFAVEEHQKLFDPTLLP
jgi:dGTPase